MKIVWTKRALAQLEKILRFLKGKGHEKKANEVIEQVEKAIELLNQNPEMGQKSEKMSFVRRYLLNPKLQMFYKFSKSILTILAFFSSRQNPKKNPFK